MNKLQRHIAWISVSLFPFFALAQHPTTKKCGSDDYFNLQLQTNTALKENQRKIESLTKEFIKTGGSRGMYSHTTAAIVTIPVVVHVLWHQSFEKISMAQIQSQIDVLNQDFQLMNADTSNTPILFRPFQANCQISFCLAKRDPNGFPTSGVIYKHTEKEWFWQATNDAKFSAQDGDDIWDRNKYLNFWVVPQLKDFLLQTIAGYAQFPGGNESTDGVVIQQNEFGTVGNAYDLGRTATHEVGHWLNLKHIWGSNLPLIDCLDGDDVDDTPNQREPHYNCDTFPQISCDNGPLGDMFMNFMDYSSDDCMNIFTVGQKDRMLALFQPGGFRYPILSSAACNGDPDFTVINPNIDLASINPGSIVTVFFAESNDGYLSGGPNYTSFHLSANNILTPGQNGDIFLDEYFVNQTIPPLSQTLLLSKQITIPSSVAPGSYYLFFSADGTNVVTEGNETNNFAAVMITVTGPCADLVITNQSVSPLSVNAGNSTTLAFTESNIGNTTAAGNYISFHLSADNVLTPGQNGDIFLGDYFSNQSLGAQDQTALVSQQVTIPASLPSGIYYVFFSADGTGVVNECDNLNNFATAVISITGIESTQSAYKYWFDNKSANAVTVSGPFGNNYTIQTNISAISLPEGLHSFTVGFKNTDQKWSSFVPSFFYKLSNNTPAGISKYEYWFDNSFAGRSIRNISATSNLIILDAFNVNAISPGLHTINLRFKPDAKHWSSVISSFFYKIDPLQLTASQYEYWFDNKYDGKITVNNTTSNDFLLVDNTNISQLTEGLHCFHIRFKPNGKNWSSISSSFFYKPVTISNTPSQYEYWFDNDYTNKTTTTVTNTNSLILLTDLPTASLTNCLHSLNIRFRPDEKAWSNIVTTFFFNAYAPPTGTAEYEFWFDNDYTNKISAIVGSTNSLIIIDNLPVASLSGGTHVLHSRFRPDGKDWSVIVSDNFQVLSVLPVQLTYFNASGNNCNSIQLKWQTASERNSEKFTIQLSSDGINYSNAGEVSASGNSSGLINYSYNLFVTSPGKYFIRLKLSDIDGQFEYSKTILVIVNCPATIMSIYPNPTTGVVNIKGLPINKLNTAAFFDLNGRLIKEWPILSSQTISIKEFAAGAYILEINEQRFKIIKQ